MTWWSSCVRVLRGELYPERNRYRDVLILVLVAVTAWAVVTATRASHTADRGVRAAARSNATSARATATAERATATAHRALAQVQEGRSTSIGVICAVESAIGQAGKETITGGAALPPALDAFLQQHGYPPLRVRQTAAQQAAGKYVGLIGTHIARELRQRGKSTKLVPKLLRRDGTINCRELQRIAHVQVR